MGEENFLESVDTMNDIPNTKEKYISQIPALQMLINQGWEYLTPEEALKQRGGKLGNVLLEGIFVEQLRASNRIKEKYPFSEGNILTAVQRLKEERFDGLVRTNEKLYDRLTLGTTLPQSIDGDTKSHPLNYIDWEHPENNVYHVTAEFIVARTASQKTRRPDIVLFVNGVPLVVIENKSPNAKSPSGEAPVEQAISQMIRNQGVKNIPRLFGYAQLLLSLATDAAKFATVGTPAKFWAVWKELDESDEQLAELVNQPLHKETKGRLFSGEFAECRPYFEELEAAGPRQVTEQDRMVAALCKPERLLELVNRYTLFDGGDKKVARYQQFFCVRKILDRIRKRDRDGARQGGVVWHTQGSGKSLTMVMLAKSLAMDLPREGADHFKIVLVTDRIDLDEQIYRTFSNCGTEPVQAKTGKHLTELLQDDKSRIITTVIDKFEAVMNSKVKVANPNVFALVDEGHRGQYGPLHAKMRRVLPKGCFIGFTGTPVMKSQKNTIDKFGGLIDTYTITQAVDDKAVVQLLYEGRDVPQTVDSEALDRWFDAMTEKLSKEQAADLKKKYATSGQLNKVDQKTFAVAWDISRHFSETWKGTPHKGQLVAANQATALKFKQYLDDFGLVTSEVLISGPDERDGHEEVDEPEELTEDDAQKVVAFWNKMMQKHGGPKEYQRNLINSFKHSESPEIIIVVYKLLTGFDAPRNTVLYLCRSMKEHSLLQAIARVNRLFDGKEFGYIIDYVGVLENLDKALDLYGKLPEFDEEDLAGTLLPVQEEVAKLPQRHSNLLEVFKTIENKQDTESYERFLADQAEREKFYQRLSLFARTLQLALSTVSFHEETSVERIAKYKEDLKFFRMLRVNVQRRYAEIVDFGEYEKRIQKLLNTHVKSGEVEQVIAPLNIFDQELREAELAKMGRAASKADAIVFATRKTIDERMDEDPAFYRKLSRLIQDVLDDWRARRLSEADYLKRAREVCDSVVTRKGEDIPDVLRNEEDARAFFGELAEVFERYSSDAFDAREQSAQAALRVDEITEKHKRVDWMNDTDVQNRMKTEIEDMLFELKDRFDIDLSLEDIDSLLERCIQIARKRKAA